MSELRCETLCASLAGQPVLRGIDCELSTGEILGIIGPNGAGKSTLLRCLAGLLQPQSGMISLAGQILSEISATELAQRLAYLPQAGNSHWAVSVETLITLGRLPHRAAWRSLRPCDHEAVERALVQCDLVQLRRRPVTQLSGGELRRVLLARALATEPQWLLADEPVAGLDPGHQLDVMVLLANRARSGAGVVIVLHDLSIAARFCDRLLLLKEGRIAAQGIPAQVLKPESLRLHYGVRAFLAKTDDGLIVVPVERHE